MQRCGVVLLVAVMACGGGGGSGGVDAARGGVDGAAGSPDAAGAAGVPDPGNGAIPFSWPDTEPNDTPQTAVPLGTSTSAGEATWFDGTQDSGSLGGDDTADFFVFRSSPDGGNFHAGPCWDGTAAPNLMDFYFYKVSGDQLQMVASSTSTDPSCENIAGEADATMEPSTVYLLELRKVAGGPAVYGA